MKPTIKKVQPVKVVAPFLNSQSESPVPLDALTDQEKVSDLYFLKGVIFLKQSKTEINIFC